jgi:hypothetical protein
MRKILRLCDVHAVAVMPDFDLQRHARCIVSAVELDVLSGHSWIIRQVIGKDSPCNGLGVSTHPDATCYTQQTGLSKHRTFNLMKASYT